MRETLDLHTSRPEMQSVGLRCFSPLVPQSNQHRLLQEPNRNDRSPLGMSRSVRMPSAPAAILVGIPKNIAVLEGLSDFLGFLSNR